MNTQPTKPTQSTKEDRMYFVEILRVLTEDRELDTDAKERIITLAQLYDELIYKYIRMINYASATLEKLVNQRRDNNALINKSLHLSQQNKRLRITLIISLIINVILTIVLI
jgi:hypothetical protein